MLENEGMQFLNFPIFWSSLCCLFFTAFKLEYVCDIFSTQVYHSFHDEVNHYKQHIWRCDGACRDRRPYNGFVKRSRNRAPSKNDLWWPDHQANCGGTFVKIHEPEGFGSKKRQKKPSGKGSSKRKTFFFINFTYFISHGLEIWFATFIFSQLLGPPVIYFLSTKYWIDWFKGICWFINQWLFSIVN